MRAARKFVFTSSLLLVTLFAPSAATAQSPYSISLKNDGLYLGGSAALSFIALSVDNKNQESTVQELNALNKNSINQFDRWAANYFSESVDRTSDYVVYSCIAAPLVMMATDNSMRNDWTIITTMYLETAILATFLPSFGKGPANRYRPFAYNTDAPLEMRMESDARRSFFSGHSTWSFASMVFLATVYSDYYPDSQHKKLVWWGAMGSASAVALMRIFAGHHFPSDVIVGALVGSTIGYGIPYLHKKNSSFALASSPMGNGLLLKFRLPLD